MSAEAEYDKEQYMLTNNIETCAACLAAQQKDDYTKDVEPHQQQMYQTTDIACFDFLG